MSTAKDNDGGTAARAAHMARLVKSHGIALTGGVATGKSTVARLIAAAGYFVIDADQLAREVTAPGSEGLAALVAAFGQEILAHDGTLDRKLLGARAFASPETRRELEALTHPRIRTRLLTKLEEAGLAAAPKTFFYEAALIYERGAQADFASVWVTHCDTETQIARLMARNALDRAAAEKILAAQMPSATKAAQADVVIDTNGSLVDVEARVATALRKIRK